MQTHTQYRFFPGRVFCQQSEIKELVGTDCLHFPQHLIETGLNFQLSCGFAGRFWKPCALERLEYLLTPHKKLTTDPSRDTMDLMSQ